MKKLLFAVICVVGLCGCSRYEPIGGIETDSGVVEAEGPAADEKQGEESREGQGAPAAGDGQTELEAAPRIEIINEADMKKPIPERTPVKVKGIYVSAYVAGSRDLMDEIIKKVDETEINAIVIDFKDDEGRITCPVDAPTINEIEACKRYVGDMGALIQELKDHDIYVIARVVTFRDPYLAEKKPEWSLKNGDGSIYRDNKGLAWVNPYKKEVWDYLVEVGTEAANLGFDEIQFDYIRFATDSTIKDVVFDEEDTKGRSKTDVITEFTEYAYDNLAPLGLFVSADVFGAIIGSEEDAASVGQIYGEMAKHLDYICPMIYPSHYGNGNFGLDYPDTKPYETILAALNGSSEVLQLFKEEGARQAVVRPWLQDFTASYLEHYIKYGPDEIRAQVKGVYDAGYQEWMLWSAANKYTWDGVEKAKEQ